MDQKRVCLTVPAEPGFARIVRMTAASLAVTCDMGVDEVEDARMAAEEGFVYACATGQQECGIVCSPARVPMRCWQPWDTARSTTCCA